MKIHTVPLMVSIIRCFVGSFLWNQYHSVTYLFTSRADFESSEIMLTTNVRDFQQLTKKLEWFKQLLQVNGRTLL